MDFEELTNRSKTHHEQLTVGTSGHADRCKGISSTDGSGNDEKEGTTDHIVIIKNLYEQWRLDDQHNNKGKVMDGRLLRIQFFVPL